MSFGSWTLLLGEARRLCADGFCHLEDLPINLLQPKQKWTLTVWDAAGMVAQSAIFTQAWQIGNLLTATDAWSRALSEAAGQELKVAQ